MNNFKLDNKKLIDKYQPTPNMYYDVEGKLIEVNGKDIKVEKKVDNEIINYTIRLKENIDKKVGDKVRIEKENIRSIEIEKKKTKLNKEESKDIGDILRKLGLEYSKENIQMIDSLVSLGIKPTKNNVNSYKKSKELLENIVEEIDTELAIKIVEKGFDLSDSSLQELSNIIDSIKSEEGPLRLKDIFKLNKELDYKAAEEISKEIYGQKMGKDIYDIIIALDKEKLDISRDSIDAAMEVVEKVKDLEDIEDKHFIEILKENMTFSINNLFKTKNNYTLNNMASNSLADKFEGFTILEDTSLTSLKNVLEELDIEESLESLAIGREFILMDMDINKEDYERILVMKSNVEELKSLLKNEDIVKSLNENINILDEDIEKLVEVIKNERISGSDLLDEDPLDLQMLEEIEDRDLLRLIRDGKNFSLSNLREIKNTNIKDDLSLDFRVLDKTKYISNMLNIIGEKPSNETISLANSVNEEITLDNLYKSQLYLEENNIMAKEISPEKESIIINEYLKAKNSISTNFIKESIIDGRDIELLPITELNYYLDKKINKYREARDLTKGVKSIKSKEGQILSLMMKNDMNLTLREVNDVNSYLKGELGISEYIKDILKEVNKGYNREYKDELKKLQKNLWDNLKDGKVGAKEDYKSLINTLSNESSGFSEDRKKDKENRFIEIQEKLSKKDLVFQIPVNLDGELKDINIIMPDMGEGIEKESMRFSINVTTKNLGEVNMNLQVVGNNILLDIDEEEDMLMSKVSFLEESFRDIGYRLDLVRER